MAMHKPVISQFYFLGSMGKKAFENIVGKGKMLLTSIISFSHNVFYPVEGKEHHLSHIAFNLYQAQFFLSGKGLTGL